MNWTPNGTLVERAIVNIPDAEKNLTVDHFLGNHGQNEEELARVLPRKVITLIYARRCSSLEDNCIWEPTSIRTDHA